MQDRFKFRVWDKSEKKMHYTDFVITSTGYAAKLQPMYELEEDENGDEIEIQCEKEFMIDQTDFEFDKKMVVMQSTGLKDKNGKLIYEGDIVQFYDDGFLKTMKIIWDNDELDFKAIGLKKSVECYEEDFLYLGYIKKEYSLEVIGNIYENPELLEVTND